MVRRETALSLMLAWALGWAMAPRAIAQPSDLYSCSMLFNQAPTCRDIGGAITFSHSCARAFEHYLGRVGWYPLSYIGPVEIEVETISGLDDQFPLYVEIVPLDGIDPTEVCESAVGQVVMTLYPTRQLPSPCNFWRSSGVVDLSTVLSVGSVYALRIYSFHHPSGDSPGIDCVRITAHLGTAAVVPASWGFVKRVFR